MATSVNLVGEGGSVWEFDLPLGEVFADQLATGKLRPADDEAAATLAAHAAADPVAEDAAEAGGNDGDGLDALKQPELVKLAAAEGIALPAEARSNAAKIAVIRAARAAKATADAAGGAGDGSDGGDTPPS